MCVAYGDTNELVYRHTKRNDNDGHNDALLGNDEDDMLGGEPVEVNYHHDVVKLEDHMIQIESFRPRFPLPQWQSSHRYHPVWLQH